MIGYTFYIPKALTPAQIAKMSEIQRRYPIRDPAVVAPMAELLAPIHPEYVIRDPDGEVVATGIATVAEDGPPFILQ